MFPYRKYFQEYDLPPAGIDKIVIRINPELINRPEDFHRYGNGNESLILRYKSEKGYRTDCYLDIHAEALDPGADIQKQVLDFLVEFACIGVLKTGILSGKHKIQEGYSEFSHTLFKLHCIEFYFDFIESDIDLANTRNPKYETTRYSPDHLKERQSVLKAYNRPARLRAKGTVPYSAIDTMRYTERIEFCLKSRNCLYFNLKNIRGDYDDIFHRFLPVLARRWRDYGPQVAVLHGLHNLTYAHYFRQIVAASKDRIPHSTLLKTVSLPTPFKRSYKEKEKDSNWAIHFLLGNTKDGL